MERIRKCANCNNEFRPISRQIYCKENNCYKITNKNRSFDKSKKLIKYSHKSLEGIDVIRERVRIRDNHTCQKCGKVWVIGQRRFDVHHLDIEMESKKNYNYDKNNQHMLITYCHKCHLNLHSVREKISLKIRQKLVDKRVLNS